MKKNKNKWVCLKSLPSDWRYKSLKQESHMNLLGQWLTVGIPKDWECLPYGSGIMKGSIMIEDCFLLSHWLLISKEEKWAEKFRNNLKKLMTDESKYLCFKTIKYFYSKINNNKSKTNIFLKKTQQKFSTMENFQ